MRRIDTASAILITLGFLAAVGITACSATGTPNSAGRGYGQTTTPAATAASSAAASATPTGPMGVQNLTISSVDKSDLTAAYVAYRGIALADVAGAGPMPSSVYYAYDPATATYWALATFEPSGTATVGVGADFYSPAGDDGLFRKSGAGTWQIEDLPVADVTLICAEAHWFPVTVLTAWSLPTSGQC